MVEPMTTGVIELFPFSCKSPKNEPYKKIGICWKMVELMTTGVIELFPFSCKSPNFFLTS